MENKHTKLPWSCRDRTPKDEPMSANGSDRFIVECNIKNMPGTKGVIAACGYRLNAELIVTACNSHYDLIEACKYALDFIECDVDGKETLEHRIITQAIAKATGSCPERTK